MSLGLAPEVAMQAYAKRLPSRGLLVTAVAGAVLLGGCGGGGGGTASSPSPTQTTSPTTGAASPGPTATRVTARLTEFAIDLSQRTFNPGVFTFVAEEQGQRPHALSIKGPGVDTKSTPVIAPGGGSRDLTVSLGPGTYELWCPVDGHKELGMDLTITVR